MGTDRFDQETDYEGHWTLPCQRVLLVDDDRDVVDTQAVLLETLGQDVRCAYDCDTALQIALEFHPQLVLLDPDMQVMSGLELARGLRMLRSTRDVRLVAQTHLSRLDHSALGAPAVFDGWIRKPASLATLIAELHASPSVPLAPVPALSRPVGAGPAH